MYGELSSCATHGSNKAFKSHAQILDIDRPHSFPRKQSTHFKHRSPSIIELKVVIIPLVA